MTINYSTTYLEGQLYAGYYLATAAPRNNDFLHWWVNGGVKPWAEAHHAASLLSIGFHFEQLYQTRNRLGDTGNLYTWLGPYLQFKWTNGIYLRFNAGWDLQNNLSNNFYKATMGFSF